MLATGLAWAQAMTLQFIDAVHSCGTLLLLCRYNALREHQAFLEGRHTCGICLEEQPGSAFVRLDQCRHAWCAGCLAEQARIHVAEGGLERLRWAGLRPAWLHGQPA